MTISTPHRRHFDYDAQAERDRTDRAVELLRMEMIRMKMRPVTPEQLVAERASERRWERAKDWLAALIALAGWCVVSWYLLAPVIGWWLVKLKILQ